MTRFPASRLRYRMTLQQAVLTPDGAGGHTREWQDMTELWAEIGTPVFREPFTAAQTDASRRHLIRIRARAGIIVGMRFAYENRTFLITNIAALPHSQRGIMELWAEEGKEA